MNTAIEVMVYYLENTSDIEQQEMGINIDLSQCILKKYKLYHVDYVTHYDGTRCVVSSAGIDFIVDESYDSLNKRIEDQKYRLN